jgi:oxygen-independent coproporphyrinogen-3 oxidase
LNPEFAKRYAAPVPRYTSYPTAPHFTPEVGHKQYAAWLAALPEAVPLSLYMHIPYCHSLCWYCGCCTKEVRRYEPIARYLDTLIAEIESVAKRLPKSHDVAHIHWGGGSPNVLLAEDIVRLGAAMRAGFSIAASADFAVEIDPRTLDDNQVAAFAKIGVNRVSVGVQDFDERVQAAINRQQSYEQTKRAIDLFRQHGVKGINIDLVYGLPHQTRDSVEDTVRQVLTLAPDRIAVFGYAHLPSRLRHQTLIPEEALPDVVERLAQSNRLANVLTAAGYVRIGLDHFARADDPIATGALSRNFQGYTADTVKTLIGLGASAIGSLPQGYVQNAPAVADYARRIAEDGLATVRGIELTEDDRMRGFVIERLMCDLAFPTDELRRQFGDAAAPILEEAASLVESDSDHLLERTAEGFRVTPRGRPFVRSIAACFDTYLGKGEARHSAGV